MKKIGEMDLILLVQEGDEIAFQELFERYKNLVYYVAFKMCHNDADAQDVVQESFIEIKRSIKNLQKPSFFKLWMYRIVNSKCKKLFRKNKFALAELDHDNVQFSLIEERNDFTPSKKMRFASDSELLQHFIDRLPAAQRMMVMMFYMEQMTTAEIAMVCDLTEGTVKSRLFTARKTLKKNIEDYERKENISLDFHDLSGALTTSFATQIALTKGIGAASAGLIIPKPKNLFSNFLQANAFAAKMAVIACASTIAVSGAYTIYQETKKPKEDVSLEKGQNKATFPIVEFKGKQISSGKDAYYTLKMNYCKQDLKNLDLTKQREIESLYQALKLENGLYYRQLQETGWILNPSN